jgi:hypothetical protein
LTAHRFRERLTASADEQGWTVKTATPRFDKYRKGVDSINVLFSPRGGLWCVELFVGQVGYHLCEARVFGDTDRERRLTAAEVEGWLREHGHWN